MSIVHETAVVNAKANLGNGVSVGPFCVIGPDVTLHDGVELLSHVVIEGSTTLGSGTKVYPFASLGHQPQDLKFAGEDCSLEFGENCVIREGVTANPGTSGGGLKTVVGNRCTFLSNSHVGHDSIIGNNVILSSNVMIAGHVLIGNDVIISGGSGIHQFSRIGTGAFIGGLAGVEHDVIPYGMVLGNRAYLGGLNLVGLKRLGVERESIHNVRRAYKSIFVGEGTLRERTEKVAAIYPDDDYVQLITNFILADSDRALCTPKS